MNLFPGHYPDLPSEDYHALEAASNSGLKQVATSMAHYLEWKKRPDSKSDSLVVGSAFHALMLDGREVFEATYAITPAEKEAKELFRDAKGNKTSYWSRTGAYKAWAEQQNAEGRDVLSREDAAGIRLMGLAVKEHDAASRILDQVDRTEHTIIWHDEKLDVPCKARFDALMSLDGQTFGVDLKTSYRGNLTQYDFAKHCARYGYGFQWRHYDAGWEALEGERLAGWLVVAVEKEPPYGVAVFQFDESWTDAAYQKHRDALTRYAEWWHDGRPEKALAYPDHIQTLEAPSWA